MSKSVIIDDRPSATEVASIEDRSESSEAGSEFQHGAPARGVMARVLQKKRRPNGYLLMAPNRSSASLQVQLRPQVSEWGTLVQS